MLGKAIIFVSLIAAPTIGAACAPLQPIFPRPDPKIKVAADCSFTEAGNSEYAFSGGAVVDLKNGKVGQRLSLQTTICALPENQRLLVVNCNTKKSIAIQGQPSTKLREKYPRMTDSHYGVETKVKYLYPPHGKIHLSATTTIVELERIATAEGYTHQREVASQRSDAKPKNRYNYFCGCKVYYPDSVGARVE